MVYRHGETKFAHDKKAVKGPPLSDPASPEKWDVSSDLCTLIQTVS